jgi:ribonuclease-3
LLTPADWTAQRLGYSFRDPALLEAALTHRSAGPTNYERLEFLGDAVLTLAAAELVFAAYPQADEGELSRYRAALVSGTSLAERAQELGLGMQLRLGGGELKSGGHRRGSILADAIEAVIGAIHLDGGFDVARAAAKRLFEPRLLRLAEVAGVKDPKTRLQEELQARGLPLPVYAIDGISGEPHEQWFVASCEVERLGLRSQGEGSSRRRAEQAAADRLLQRLAEEPIA